MPRVVTELTQDCDHLRYLSTPNLAQSAVIVTVSLASMAAAIPVAKRWAWWNRPALMRFADGAFDYDTLCAAEREMIEAVRQAPYLTSEEYAGIVFFMSTVQKVTVNVGSWNERKE